MQDASRATLLHRSEASAIVVVVVTSLEQIAETSDTAPVEDAVVWENRESSNVMRKCQSPALSPTSHSQS